MRWLSARRLAVGLVVVALTVVGCSRADGSATTGVAEAADTVTTSSAAAQLHKAAAAKSVASARKQLGELTTAFAMNPNADVSISALDTTTGRTLQYGAIGGMVEASAVKVEILVATLLQHQDERIPMDAGDDSLATKMIQNSDNDAAVAMFDELGGTAALNTANTRLGLGNTEIGTGGYFGFTTTNAQDQVTLLKVLTASNSPLDAASRSYALGLMRGVAPDESWGVTVAADESSSPAVKNGWLPVDNDDDRWSVTSMGVITVGGHQVLMAVLAQHQDTQQIGIDYIEQASKLVAAGLTAPD